MKVIVNDIKDLTELKRDKIINRFCNIGYDVVLDIVDLNFLKNLHKTQMEVFIKEKLIMEKVLFVSGSHWLMMTILMMMIDRKLRMRFRSKRSESGFWTMDEENVIRRWDNKILM